jgi:hypothetical protein
MGSFLKLFSPLSLAAGGVGTGVTLWALWPIAPEHFGPLAVTAYVIFAGAAQAARRLSGK